MAFFENLVLLSVFESSDESSHHSCLHSWWPRKLVLMVQIGAVFGCCQLNFRVRQGDYVSNGSSTLAAVFVSGLADGDNDDNQQIEAMLIIGVKWGMCKLFVQTW